MDDYDDTPFDLEPYALPATPVVQAPAGVETSDAEASAVTGSVHPEIQVDLSILPRNARYSFITGSAGTGKTTLVRAWCREERGAVLCATTGIAAVNLGDAVTVNSLLGYFDTTSLRDNYIHGFLQSRLRKLRAAGTTRYILDEVSMLEADALALLVGAFEDVNNEASVLRGDEPEIGLTLVGDFLQLPPIGEKPEKGRRETQAKYAFESPVWAPHFAPNVVRLSTIHRQADPDFIAALRALRDGTDLELLTPLHACLDKTLDFHFEGTTIFAKNSEVDRFNQLRLRELPPPSVIYTSTRDGKARGEWKNIPETLVLRPGALVMVLSNFYDDDASGNRHIVAANGDLATFESPIQAGTSAPHAARVRLYRTGEVVTIPYVTEHNRKATGNPRQPWETVGFVKYLPLRLAWGTTVHKSQGLSLDRVQLAIADPFWGAPAMLYVGVSRARNLEGLRIIGNMAQLKAKVNFDPRVAEWR